MVETAGPQQEQPLPRVYLTEDWKIVYVVLLYAYNMPLFGDIMRVGTPATVLLEVFEAANKYQITALRVLCSTLLRLSVSDMDDKEALLVFTRASLVNDEDLARIVVQKAAELPLQNISMDTLRELPIGALHHLICTHAQHVNTALADFKAWSYEDRQYICPQEIQIALKPLYQLV